MEKNYNINMSGEEFLKWEERKKVKYPAKFLRFMRFSWIWFVVAAIFAGGGAIILDIIFKKPIPPLTTTLIYGYAIPNVLIFVVVCSICLAWVVHGFGFIIIKR